MKTQLIILLAVVMVIGFSGESKATSLVDRGNGFIYDTDFDITWLQEPNNTPMNWYQAMDWVSNLDVEGVTGWCLPTALNQDGSGPDLGYSFAGSEMAHLFYVELGNDGFVAPDGSTLLTGWGLINKGPFTNLLPDYYWTSTEYTPDWSTDPNIAAWDFDFNSGGPSRDLKEHLFFDAYALAVHDGDVGAPVPIPGAVWLFGSSIAGIIGIKRRAKT